MSTSTFHTLVLFFIVGLIVVVLGAAYTAGATPETVTDEPITVDYDAESSVDVDGVSYNETTTVVVGGATLQEGVDYSWDASVGNVSWHNTTATTDGETGTIDYTASTATNESKGLASIGALFGVAIALLALLSAGWGALKAVVG